MEVHLIKAKIWSDKLRMTILYTAVLDQAVFRDAELYRAVLSSARGIGTILTKADLGEIHAPNAHSITHISMPRSWNRPISW